MRSLTLFIIFLIGDDSSEVFKRNTKNITFSIKIINKAFHIAKGDLKLLVINPLLFGLEYSVLSIGK